MRYRYFVSFAHGGSLNGNFGFGNIELHRDRPILGHDDVAQIGRDIASENNLQWATVLHFHEYRTVGSQRL